MTNPIKAEPAFDAKDIVRFLLEATHTTEPPTNAEKIAQQLKLIVRGFFHHEYRLDPKIRAYLLPAKKEIGIARNLSRHRTRFSILHEVGHYVIPGHVDNAVNGIMVDDDKTLADYSIIKQEMEANQFAADCLFQLDQFFNDVKDVDMTWDNISKFAGIYDTSLVAAARRWVETSHNEYALLVFTPTALRSMAPLKLSYTITSNSFSQKYFARIPQLIMDSETQVFQTFHKTDNYADRTDKLTVDTGLETFEFDLLLFPTLYGVYALVNAE